MHINLRGQRLWFDVTEDKGPPVLLVMGFGMSSKAWEPQVEELRHHHRVITFDNRGVGQSDRSAAAYDLRDLADDAALLLDHLDVESAHVAGVSMGGMTAQHLAIRHRARVRSLSLIVTHPGGGPLAKMPTANGLRLFLKANTSVGEQRFGALRQLLYPAAFRERMAVDEDFSKDSLDSFAVPADRQTLLWQLKAVIKHDARDGLKSLADLPVLVVRGDQDVLVPPKHSDRIHALVPGSTLIAFADAGHGVSHQQKRAVNRHLLAHFENAERIRRAATPVPTSTSTPADENAPDVDHRTSTAGATVHHLSDAA